MEVVLVAVTCGSRLFKAPLKGLPPQQRWCQRSFWRGVYPPPRWWQGWGRGGVPPPRWRLDLVGGYTPPAGRGGGVSCPHYHKRITRQQRGRHTPAAVAVKTSLVGRGGYTPPHGGGWHGGGTTLPERLPRMRPSPHVNKSAPATCNHCLFFDWVQL